VSASAYGLHEIQVEGIWDLERSDPAVCVVDVTTLPFIRSDMNADGRIDIADAVYLMSYLFHSSAEPPCLEGADSNNDGKIDVADAVFPLMYLFQNGKPPSAPFPTCGIDPEAEDGTLGCASHPPCSGP
jgi:hypothetical protein